LFFSSSPCLWAWSGFLFVLCLSFVGFSLAFASSKGSIGVEVRIASEVQVVNVFGFLPSLPFGFSFHPFLCNRCANALLLCALPIPAYPVTKSLSICHECLIILIITANHVPFLLLLGESSSFF